MTELEGLEPLDERQTMEERGLDWEAYWAKREQDRRDEKQFWLNWSKRWPSELKK